MDFEILPGNELSDLAQPILAWLEFEFGCAKSIEQFRYHQIFTLRYRRENLVVSVVCDGRDKWVDSGINVQLGEIEYAFDRYKHRIFKTPQLVCKRIFDIAAVDETEFRKLMGREYYKRGLFGRQVTDWHRKYVNWIMLNSYLLRNALRNIEGILARGGSL